MAFPRAISANSRASNLSLPERLFASRSMHSLAIATILIGSLMSGCAERLANESTGEGTSVQSDAAMEAPQAVVESNGDAAGSNAGAELGTTTFVADVPQSSPQLVKRAEMALEVDDMETAIQQAMAIARSTGGDVLNLQNQTPPSETATHTAFLELRIPQAQLNEALNRLADVGAVKRQSMSAEDVSTQLVDLEARLRNLRKAEDMVLGIMERSGEIGEVLQVAQELRNIRGSIEQIDGQLNALKTRVRFSTVSLNLTRPGAATPSQSGVWTQVQDTWNSATRSMATFTVDLMQLGIWLMVYSPYVLVMAGLGWGGLKWLRRDRPSLTAVSLTPGATPEPPTSEG